jgi:surface polysaccharide O-acyltransferase-like enzyme
MVAAKNKWLNAITYRTGKRLALLALLLLLFFPVFYFIIVKLGIPVSWYSGGLHWETLLYAVWEQLIGFSIITALLVFGKKLWDKPSAFLSKLSRYTFAVYIFHPLIVISLSLAFANWPVDPAIKLLIVAPLAVVGNFLLASVILLVPGVKRII